MIRCFLSHSSKDKQSYVEPVARKLPKDWRIYDADTFEAGMRTLDEIAKGLDQSSLFVIFLSDASLDSDWVRLELTEAKMMLDQGQLKRILPIVIDRTVSHTDKRIPDWLREQYNLRAVTRSSVAARQIQQRLRELSWEVHPRLKERQQIFVGRNDQIAAFEQRFDDYDKAPPIAVICSGLPAIGRKTLIRHGFVKVGLRKDSYVPPSVTITAQDSIEDFIIKVYDLGYSEVDSAKNLLDKSMEQKIKIAAALCQDIANAGDVLLIEDSGGIVTYERGIVDWFRNLVRELSSLGRALFGVASRFRPDFSGVRGDEIFVLQVPELNETERMGLFKRLSEFEGLILASEDFKFFKDVLYGFPDQVQYAVSLIQDKGLPTAKRSTELLVAFNTDRAAKLVDYYAPSDSDREFLYILSEFEFISYDFLETLVDLTIHGQALARFLSVAICEPVGSSGEYIRLNDSIRDHMRRLRLKLPKSFEQKLRAHVDDFIAKQDKEEIDASEYLYAVKKALASGQDIDNSLLVPSHFLNAMKELYDRHRNYRQVVILADRVLRSEAGMDANIAREIRYYLCQSLARRRDPRFLAEVQSVSSPEHQFLLGFYYRMVGRVADAIDQQRRAEKHARTASRARRELVQLFISIENYPEALELARLNYHDRPSNPFHIQAYLKCLIHSKEWRLHESEMKQLFEGLRKASITSERAGEMWLTATALYLAVCENNFELALESADAAAHKYSNSPYPLFTKASLLLHRPERINELEHVIRQLSTLVSRDGVFELPLHKLRSQLLFMQGRQDEGMAEIESYLRGVPNSEREPAFRRLQRMDVIVPLESEVLESESN